MGSVASKMSADPRTRPDPVVAPSSAPLPLSSRPSSAAPSPTASSPAPHGAHNGATKDINSLRAAALKSRMKKAQTSAEAASRSRNPTPAQSDREEGEISDGTPPRALTPPPPSAPSQASRPPVPTHASAPPAIARSTVVTLSPSQRANSDSQPPMSKEEEAQYLEELRSLVKVLSVDPNQLVAGGAPHHLVRRVCEEVVAEERARGSLRVDNTRPEIWQMARSPIREGSGTPGVPDALQSARASRANSSRNSSPDVEVVVHTTGGATTSDALSPSSDSSMEAMVERMVPPQPLQLSPAQPSPRSPQHPLPPIPPRATPLSSWPTPPFLPSRPAAPQALRIGSAVPIDSYRPIPRPSTVTLPPSLVPTQQSNTARGKGRKRRDLDSAASFPATLDYGDDAGDGEATTTRLPEPAAAPPPTPPPTTIPPGLSRAPPSAPPLPAPRALPARVPSPPSIPPPPAPPPPPARADELAEARRRLLDSMRRKKTGTPASAPATPVLTTSASTPWSRKSTPPDQAADEQVSSGSTTETPMDIDTEMEDGEIADSEEGEVVDDDQSTNVSTAASSHLWNTPTVAEPISGASMAPPPIQAPTPVRAPSRTNSRGVKRPHAEDLMDQPSRPSSASRPRRKIFCVTAQRPTALALPLDDASDSEAEDEQPTPVVVPPVIMIPPEWETLEKEEEKARAIAEKEEHIRRLRARIAELAEKKKTSSAQATPTGALTPATASSIAESAIKGAFDNAIKSMPAVDGADSGDDDLIVAAEDQGMDIDEQESSTVVEQAKANSLAQSNFRPYKPLLTQYRQLASNSPPANTESTLTRDPDVELCPFEAAGGRCTDLTCQHLHLHRAEPTDDDLVVYVSQILAPASASNPEAPGRTVIAEALKAARAELSSSSKTTKTRAGSKKDGSRAGSSGDLSRLLAMTARLLRAR